MKHTLLGAASALALVTFAGAANAQDSTGYIGASWGQMDLGGFDVDILDIGGTASWQISESLESQFDLGYTSYDASGGDADVLSGAAHLFFDNQNFKAGGVIGFQDAGNASVWAYGVEGRFFLSDNITVGGSWVTGDLDVGALEVDIDSLRADASLFVSDTFRLDASVQGTTFDFGSGFEVDTTTWGIGGEYQFGANPFSIFAKYETTDFDVASLDADTWTLGARWVFGGTLKERDRASAPFFGVGDLLGGAFTGLLVGAAGELSQAETEYLRDFIEDHEGGLTEEDLLEFFFGEDEGEISD